jgi:Tfp pilus assembly ATPase PilU
MNTLFHLPLNSTTGLMIAILFAASTGTTFTAILLLFPAEKKKQSVD